MSRVYATIIVLLLAYQLPTAWCIKCYVCNSSDDPECNREPHKLRLIACDSVVEKPSYVRYNPLLGKATGCMKRITAYDNTTLSVVRECYFGDLLNTVDGCLELHSGWTPLVRIQSCSICGESACNEANSLHQQHIQIWSIVYLLVIVSVISSLLLKRN